MTTQQKVYRLLEEQRSSWELLRRNYAGLARVKTRSFDFGHYRMDLQFNPERIISSGAKVDAASIQERPCFLCESNRPPEQNSVLYDGYEILCNPFPIFRDHLTIAKQEHTPQLIMGAFEVLLQLSRELPDMALFYNGPQCGASAPDHMHFQAGNRGLMPLERDYEKIAAEHGRVLLLKEGMTAVSVDDGLRRFITIDAADEPAITRLFNMVYEKAGEQSPGDEPMMNILVYFDGRWRVHLFLRELHRPAQYFEEGEGNIMFSPASVDMGGTLILPMEKDFQKITKTDISDMFAQVSLSEEKFNDLAGFIKGGSSQLK